MAYRMETVSSTMRIGRNPNGLDIETTIPPHSFFDAKPVDEAYITSIWVPNDHIYDLREWLIRNA